MAGMGGVRVSIALDPGDGSNGALVASPSWTDITALGSNIVAGYSLDRGRQFELDYTDTGTYTVKVYDVDGLLDFTNSSSDLYGYIDADLQIKVDLWNPVASAWSTRFRGWIEDYDYDVDPSQRVQTLTISCYDIFALLSSVEMYPGVFGVAPPTQSKGMVYFPNDTFNDRITRAIGPEGVGLPTDFYEVFSGNVMMIPTVYSPGDTPMNVIQDALDAEFPGVSNAYPDRFGRLAAHGRLAKFDPSGTWTSIGADDAARNAVWALRHWKIGDGAAIEGDTQMIQMRPPYAWNHGRSRIINSALCYPQDVSAGGLLYRQFGDSAHTSEITDQYVQDPTSIGIRGYASWSRENLQLDNGILTGNTGPEEAKLYGTFYVTNYAEPRSRVTSLTVMAIRPTEDRASRVWDFLCNSDIADTVALTVSHPGGGGFNAEPFFIEGITEEASPLTKDYAMVTMSIDISPAAYYDNPVGLDGAT